MVGGRVPSNIRDSHLYTFTFVRSSKVCSRVYYIISQAIQRPKNELPNHITIMPATRAQAHVEKHPQHDTHSAPENTTMKDDPPIWCLAELEKSGDMHPDAYKHAPQPKGPKYSSDKNNNNSKNNPRKRKDSIQNPTASSSPPAKAARRSKTPDTKSNGGTTAKTGAATPTQTLRFLLSPRALPLTTPAAESEQGSSTRTYASARLTPFEELLSAVILSRPISHALGQRAIRTLLNPPYALTTPGKVAEAGEERLLEALWEARTQHKEKTAEQVRGLAEAVVKRGWGASEEGALEGVREEAGRVWEKERQVLREGIKGLGETGLDIFGRRMQWLWEEVFPFVDGRTKGALEELGLPGEASELRKLMEKGWENLGVKDIGLKDEGEKKRRAFTIVLERAVGASLEKKVQEIASEAAKE